MKNIIFSYTVMLIGYTNFNPRKKKKNLKQIYAENTLYLIIPTASIF